RPGQTIQYKGVSYQTRLGDEDHYSVRPNAKITVLFSDPNGKLIAKRSHRTNDFGSFSGSFTAPRDRLTGAMSLRTESGGDRTNVRVEEYKRPKFEVEVLRPTDPVRLDRSVTVKGKATGYTGASINDAKVAWRVVREVRYPSWWYWRCWWMPVQNNSEEIAHGVASTNANGTFEISFDAKPDLRVRKDSEPTFEYRVYADVTDTTGETRSAQQVVRVGYTAMAASISAPGWLTADQPLKLNVRTESLDGIGLAASGMVKVHRLKQPESTTRESFSSNFAALFQMPPPGKQTQEVPSTIDPSNPNSWPLADVVAELPFETNASGAVDLSIRLPAGIYRAVLSSEDEFNEPIAAYAPLQILDTTSDRCPIRLPRVLSIESKSLQPGQTLRAIWGSGYESARVHVEIEHRGRVVQSYWTQPGKTQVLIQQPVLESMRGGFVLRTTMVRNNRAYLQTDRISVPWDNKKLSIEWERFVSKLAPGQKETWTAIIKGPDAKAAAAEMVATLYDASLDAYSPHRWMTAFNVFRRNNSSLHSQFHNRSTTLSIRWRGWTQDYRNAIQGYPTLANRLIQSLWGYQFQRGRGANMAFGMAPMSAPRAAGMAMSDNMSLETRATTSVAESESLDAGMVSKATSAQVEKPVPDGPDLSQVSARKNLNETAFFFPQLTTDQDGTVRMEFTMPEALTRWKFIGFAHDVDLRSSPLTDEFPACQSLRHGEFHPHRSILVRR
ncbi:MAG: MG2 domain-containing protein, partial [Planctomycetota bacterium]